MDVWEVPLVVSDYLAEGIETKGQISFISLSRDYQFQLESFADSIDFGLFEMSESEDYDNFNKYYGKLLEEIVVAIKVVEDNISIVERGGIPKRKFVDANTKRRVTVLMTLSALLTILVEKNV